LVDNSESVELKRSSGGNKLTKKNDGKKKQRSTGSRTLGGKKDGKKCLGDQLQDGKLTVKYTFERTKEDVENIEKLRKHLQNNQCSSWKSYNMDSEIYRDLPGLYFDAVNHVQQLDLQVDELTAKLQQLDVLKGAFCRIFEICKDESE